MLLLPPVIEDFDRKVDDLEYQIGDLFLYEGYETLDAERATKALGLENEYEGPILVRKALSAMASAGNLRARVFGNRVVYRPA